MAANNSSQNTTNIITALGNAFKDSGAAMSNDRLATVLWQNMSQSMRRSIQELVLSIDPNIKIEPEVEDLLLDIADEFIDSVTNFGCRLAKHRGGDMLEVRDLQLHLERNHNIRIPGFASDMTPIALSQAGVAPTIPNVQNTKKGAQGTQNSLRAHRLAQVAQAKREAKLM